MLQNISCYGEVGIDSVTGLGNGVVFRQELSVVRATAEVYGADIGMIVLVIDKYDELVSQTSDKGLDAKFAAVGDYLREELKDDENVVNVSRFNDFQFKIIYDSLSQTELDERAKEFVEGVKGIMDWDDVYSLVGMICQYDDNTNP